MTWSPLLDVAVKSFNEGTELDLPPAKNPATNIEPPISFKVGEFQDVFDANCYLYLSRSIDWFDIIDYGSSSEEVLGKTGLDSALILGVESDILFPINQQKELAEYLSTNSTKVTYKSLDCIQGHDSFLVDIERFSEEIKCYLKDI